jgi:hypothetical protein
MALENTIWNENIWSDVWGDIWAAPSAPLSEIDTPYVHYPLLTGLNHEGTGTFTLTNVGCVFIEDVAAPHDKCIYRINSNEEAYTSENLDLSSNGLSGTSDFVVSYWANHVNGAANVPIVNNEDAATNQCFQIRNKGIARNISVSVGNSTEDTTTWTFEYNTWYHYTWAFREDRSEVYLYVSGIYVELLEFALGPNSFSSEVLRLFETESLNNAADIKLNSLRIYKNTRLGINENDDSEGSAAALYAYTYPVSETVRPYEAFVGFHSIMGI